MHDHCEFGFFGTHYRKLREIAATKKTDTLFYLKFSEINEWSQFNAIGL